MVVTAEEVMVAPERASTSVRSALTAPDALPVVVRLACSRRALDCSSAERSAKGIAIGSPSSALLLSMAAYSLRRATASALESSGGASSSPSASPFKAEKVSPAAYILRVASASGEVSKVRHCAGSKSPAAAGCSSAAPAAA